MAPARDPSELGGQLILPRPDLAPFRVVTRRVLIACALLLVMALLVWLDGDGYSDNDGRITFIDALYYATVSASTTGFGDIAPVTPGARLLNIVVVTPLRVAFLALMIGGTIEVLTRAGRERLSVTRWRRSISGHTVIVGFGIKGQAALTRLLRDGVPPSQVVAVTLDADGVARAARRGVVAIAGDGSRDDVLLAAGVDRAAAVIVAVPTDATAVLVTLTARRLNPRARIVAAARESENAVLLRAGGADSVTVSAGATGRQLAMGLTNPVVGDLYSQMLDPDRGVELTERTVTAQEVGRPADSLDDLVLAVARDGRVVDVRGGRTVVLEEGDRLVLLRGGAEGPTPSAGAAPAGVSPRHHSRATE